MEFSIDYYQSIVYKQTTRRFKLSDMLLGKAIT